MKKRVIALVLTLAMAVATLSACGIVKVVKIGEEGKYTGATEFNAGDDVAKIWESAAIPELNEKAVELKTLLEESKGDLKSVADKYGKYSMGDSGELSYVVKGSGTVEEVNTKSKAGYILIRLDDYTGEDTIKIQIGPVYKGSAIRDSLSFIKFGDYTNQEDWAAISQSINKVVDDTIVKKMDLESLQGKNITFKGAFTVALGSKDIIITPFELEAK